MATYRIREKETGRFGYLKTVDLKNDDGDVVITKQVLNFDNEGVVWEEEKMEFMNWVVKLPTPIYDLEVPFDIRQNINDYEIVEVVIKIESPINFDENIIEATEEMGFFQQYSNGDVKFYWNKHRNHQWDWDKLMTKLIGKKIVVGPAFLVEVVNITHVTAECKKVSY